MTSNTPTPAPAPMTASLAARLRELMEEATPGPWDCWDMDEFGYHIFEKKRGTKQDCRKSLMAVRWGRSHPEGPNIPHQRDPGRTANFNEMVANAELVCELVNNAPTILRLLEALEGAEKALARLDVFWTAEFPEGPENPEPWGKIDVRLSEETIAIWCGIRSALATLRAAREGAR